MHPEIELMLKKYNLSSVADYDNALKEIIQQITLLGLWRSKFFEKASFYGGTALRIFYGLNRFSEDLDFSLLEKNLNFKLDQYNEAIATELSAFGFNVEIQSKIKESKIKECKSNIDSILIKANAKEQFLNVLAPIEYRNKIHSQQKIKIKMEVDVNPPLNFDIEARLLLNPIPFEVNVFSKPDLFATKVHAILCRNWGKRVKGRDWFDFVWYISNNIKLHMFHLETRLRESGVWQTEYKLKENEIQSLIRTKISEIDFDDARKDVLPFIPDPSSLKLWSKNFFEKLVSKMEFI